MATNFDFVNSKRRGMWKRDWSCWMLELTGWCYLFLY